MHNDQISKCLLREWRSLISNWNQYDSWRQGRNAPSPLQRFSFALLSVLLIIGFYTLVGPQLGGRSPFLLYIAAVAASAWYGNASGGTVATLLSVVAASLLSRPDEMIPFQVIIFSIESLIITSVIASLRYTLSLSQERADQLQQNGDQMRALVDGITDYAIFLVDPKGYILSWSDAASAIQGYREHEVIGRKFAMFYVPEELASGKPDQDLQTARQSGRHEEEGWVMRKDGSTFWGNKLMTALSTPKGELRGFAYVTRDMTERREAEDLIQHQAYHDGLTGLPNRLYLQENLTSLMRWANRRNELIGVMFLDLDRFKAINDSLGHELGDVLLKEVAQRLVGIIGRQDLVGRLGSDEFALIINGIQGNVELIRLAEEISAALKIPIDLNGHQLHIQASIGAAIYPHHGETAVELMQNAEIALYQSKQTRATGCENLTLYTKEMNIDVSKRINLESELRHAIDSNQFRIHYQPIFSITKEHTVAAEALVRWQHPTIGLISPGEFIPLAEETGMILEIGAQVIDSVCQQQAEWIRQGLTVVPVAVNLSARQFAQNNLHVQIEKRLRQYRLDPAMLTVEVTETVAMQDIESTVNKLIQIGRIGVDCAIDDFGTGFSSLNYLKRLPIAKVKIDKSFIDQCVNDPKDGAIIKAIISMAHTLKLKVVAEGIEDTAQLQLLRSAHCDCGQGYLVSRPEPAEEFSKRLDSSFVRL